jgi:surface antigen
MGTARTFSKLKQTAKSTLDIRNNWATSQLKKAKNSIVQTSEVTHKLGVISRKPRLLVHAGMATAVAAVVLGAQFSTLASRTSVASRLNHTLGYGSVLDASAAADVAAKVASAASLTVSADATQKASSINAQVALAGTDDTLAKRQVVSTASTVRHDITTYTIKAGDTLGEIAKQYNVTSDTLRWANGIDDPTAIHAGQTLKVLPVTGVLHTVVAGDTTAGIAGKYQAVEAQLVEYNDLDVKGLVPGQQVIVPEGRVQEAPKVKAAVQTTVTTRAVQSWIGAGNGYPYGQCTYHIAEMRQVPTDLGNAINWRWSLPRYGFSFSQTPVPGAIAWTPYGWGGYGHVAYVESVGNGVVTISERNFNGNPNISYRTVSWNTFQGYLN